MIDCGTTTETGIESDHTAVKLKIRMTKNIPKKITSTKSPKSNEEQTNSEKKFTNRLENANK